MEGGRTMRKLKARGFVLELVSFVALILTVALAWLGDLLQLSAAPVISASIGISVAAYIWALKWELSREIRDKLSIYSMLEKIEDEDLYERGKTAIEECRVELENLSKGILRIDAGRFYRYIIKFTDVAKRHIRVAHVGIGERQLDLVRPTPENQWYQHNLELVKRGVVFERCFILSQATEIDVTSGKLKPSIAEVLQKQEQDGITVYVVWEEELDDPDLLQEFLIIDKSSVLSGAPSWSGKGYLSMSLYRRKYDIERYIEVSEALRARGHSLLDLRDLL
jgi:hypothetical protein